MAVLEIGTLVELVSGSPRMAVEKVEGQEVSVVWCNGGIVSRDTFNLRLVRKCEERSGGGGDRGGRDDRGPRGGGGFGGRDDRGPRGDKKPFNKDRKTSFRK